MKSVFLIAIVAVAMIGVMVPNVFADNVAIVTVEESGFSQACVDTGCYVPLITTVSIGDTVIMTNTDSTGVHTFTSGIVDEFLPLPDGVFDTGVLMYGDSFEWVPTQSGEYLYYCMLHTWMIGLIEVQGSEAPVEPTVPITLNLILDPIPSSVTEGEDILFSGVLMTSDGMNLIIDAEIQIKDDRTGLVDSLIGVITTDENGEFAALWKAELRPTNGAYDFYAVFEDVDFGTRSGTYSVNVLPSVELQPPPIIQSTKITMNPIPSPIKISKIITITGLLTTSDGLPISNKEIQLSNYPYDSDILSNPVITNSKGEFSINWMPEKLSPYYLLVNFNGDENYQKSKSSFSGQEVYVERLDSSISLDSFQSNILPGSVIIFSGNLNLEGTNPSGQTVYIKDEDALDMDDVLATAVVDSNGFFSTNWVVEDVDSDDRKNAVEILELYDPISFGGIKKINQLFNTLQSQTVEIYASFEETATFKKSDTCITEYADDGTSTVCQNNVLNISGEELGGKELLDILTDDESKNNQSKLFSILEGGEISDKDIESLEEMLLDSKYVQEQNLDQQEMSLNDIFTLLENPNSLTDNFEQTLISDFDNEQTLEEAIEMASSKISDFDNEQTLEEAIEMASSKISDVTENVVVNTISNEKLTCGTGTIEKDGVCVVDTSIQTEKIVVEEQSIDEEGGGCLIATATYGSEMSQQVQQLRELRDNTLLQTESGTAFMSTFNDVYYSFSPIIADYERENPYFKKAVKIAITPMISSLSLMENAESESEVLSMGISVITLNLAMYLGVPAIVIVGLRRII
ncbi:hypothetical protein OAH57_01475 [Nitrosopumilus sp.]|nr:CFI-box-CTERM domain-containing protein [Nitrosopumilus sp.]MDB4857206.1 hypothetical protein [Nitrosopumilus sp.]